MINTNKFCEDEKEVCVDTCHLQSHKKDEYLHDKYKGEEEIDRHHLCCGCCYCDESAASLSSVKSKYIEEWLNDMPVKAEPIIPEELVEVFKFFKQQSMEQIKLATILKECKTETKKNVNEQYQVVGREVKQTNKLHLVELHKKEEKEEVDSNVLENNQRRGSYDHLLTGEWTHKFPFFTSCMQDLTTNKESFVNENATPENGVKMYDERIACANVNEHTNKLLLHSSSVIEHESSQQNLFKKKSASILKSAAKTNKIADSDVYIDGEYFDEGGLTSVQQSTNNYNSTRRTSTVLKTSFNSVSLHLECEEDMQCKYSAEMLNKTPEHFTFVNINNNVKNITCANKCNHKLNKSNSNSNDYESNTDGNDDYHKNVQTDNNVDKNAIIKDVNVAYSVKDIINLTRHSSYSFNSVYKFCDNTHSFIAKVNEVEEAWWKLRNN